MDTIGGGKLQNNFLGKISQFLKKIYEFFGCKVEKGCNKNPQI